MQEICREQQGEYNYRKLEDEKVSWYHEKLD